MERLTVRAFPVSSGNDPMSAGGARSANLRPDGSFTVGGCREGLTYRVSAREREREFGGGSRSESVEAKAGDRDVVLTYKSETALVFQVVDADTGRGIETLNVQAGFRWPMPLFEEGQPKQKTHFDEGRVRFPSLPQGGADDLAQVRIESAGYETYERKDLRVARGVDNDLGTIRLRHAALVHVTVLEASTGAPIQGAKVSLNQIDPSGSQRGTMFSIDIGGDGEESIMGSGAAQRGVTDKEGKVAVSSLPGKRATLTVRQPQHATWKSAPIDLPVTGDHDETVKLLAGGSVLVRVQDSAGKPVAGLSVDHRNPEDDGGMTFAGMAGDTITDGEGQVAFSHLAAGKHLFRVRTNSGGPMMLGGGAVIHRARLAGGGDVEESDKGWTAVDVAEGGSASVTLQAPVTGTLTGRVRESGKALAGATVRAKPASDDGPDFSFLDNGSGATTSASGEYSIDGLAAGDYTVTITHPSRAMSWKGNTSVREGQNRFDVDLPLAVVEGRVTGEDGKPMANVKVRAERSRGEGREIQMLSIVAGSDGESYSIGDGVGAPPAVTDADGRYKLRGVAPDVALQVVASAPGAQTTRSEPVTLAADQTRSGVDLVLKMGATVEVVTRRPDGTKASGCIVHARPVGDDGAEPKTQFVGSTGRVTFTGLQPGRWRFTCNQAGIDSGSGNTPAIPDQEVEVKVGPPATITFDVPS
jgi:protocatechuate 3,4-dioxygenase beta subunit